MLISSFKPILFKALAYMFVVFLISGRGDFQDPALLNESLLLAYTLNGSLILVDRGTGHVYWQYDSGFSLECKYNGGPIIVPELQTGQLYKYSNNLSTDIIYRLDNNIVDLVTRSPETLASLYSTGYKVDHWLNFDIDSGKIERDTSILPQKSCDPPIKFTTNKSVNNLALGISQYHFQLWDLALGSVRFNMTYQILSSQADPDDQSSSNLTHLATLQPSILTFNGTKFLWRLALSSPLVDLFIVYRPAANPHEQASSTSPTTSSSPIPSTIFNDPPSVVVMERGLQHAIRRVLFTTYALSLNETFFTSNLPSSLEAALWEEKFHAPMNLVPALFVGESKKRHLYAIRTFSETSLNRRGTQRVSDNFWLSDTAYLSVVHRNVTPTSDLTISQYESVASGSYWPKSILGLYDLSAESPRLDPAWSSRSGTPSNRRYRLTDTSSSNDAIILPGYNLPIPLPSVKTAKKTSSTDSSGFLHTLFFQLFPTFFSVLPILATCLFIARQHRRQLELQQIKGINSPYLGSSFDSQDAFGWGGHTAESIGHPELVRFNFHEILGRGSNGTVVFNGLYGSLKVAVKRILRRPEFEKSWTREHRILLHHHHENIIHCYWTGSSPNFHYIVLQFCTTTLMDVFKRTNSANFDTPPLLAFGLTGVQSIHQLVNAVSFLHRNGIVHRDIKPGNIFLLETTVENRFRMVLGDFGLALPVQNGHFHNSLSLLFSAAVDNLPPSETAESGRGLPSDVLPLGSLGWMAPELCDLRAASLTQSVDVFSLGLVAFFILSEGKHPFDSPPHGAGLTIAQVGDNRAIHNSSVYHPFSIQQAINENRRTPNCWPTDYEDFDGEDGLDRVRGLLSYQLINDALNFCPEKRSSVDVLASSPLFWTAGEVMTFYTELSNFLDEPKPTSTGGVKAGADPPESDGLSSHRKDMLTHLENYAMHVFSGSWLRHLDQVLVDDLRSVRSYQENSVVHLLRAIRNKRNHLWTLESSVRKILGETDHEMTEYWNSRFPSLLPLLFVLSRCHLHALPQFQRFWPNVSADFKLPCERAHELLLHCKPITLSPLQRMQANLERGVQERNAENLSIDIKMKSEIGSPDNYKRTRRHRQRPLQKS